MNIDKVREKVDGIPHMSFDQAEEMTNVILENRFQNILELGFKHGVSTCYMAGALDELGGGSITTIDRINVQNNEPNIDTLLTDLGLAKYVTVFYEPDSYLWRMMKMLEEDPFPRFDFCYIDGAHNWFTDGFAFFLVDRLLKVDGMIIFDDLDWTYEKSSSLRKRSFVKRMQKEQRKTPQIRKVYELLVKSHPSYDQFMEKRGWAYARKMSSTGCVDPDKIKREVIYEGLEKNVSQNKSTGFLGSILGKFWK